MSDIIAFSPVLLAAITGLIVMVLDLLSGKDTHKGFLGWVTAVGLLASGTAACLLWVGGREISLPFMVGMVQFDTYGAFFVTLIAIAGAASSLLIVDHNPEQGIHDGATYPLVAFATFGAMLFVVATDMILLFLGLEIMSLALYVLAASKQTSPFSMEAGVKYFLLGALASGFFLFGAAFLYGATGSLDFVTVGRTIQDAAAHGSGLSKVALVMIIAALGFKIAAVPFHFWTPDVYEGSPTPISAFMAGVVKAAGFAVLARMMLTIWGTAEFSSGWQSPGGILLILAVISMVVGNIMGIVQDNVKRILAYSSISHAGYILLGVYAIGLGEPGAVGISLNSGVPFYLLTYVLATVGAFGVLALMGGQGHEDMSLDSIAGLGKRSPILALILTISVLSLAGIPPLLGFMGKFVLFKQVLLADPDRNWVWVVVAVLNSLVALYYYLRIVLYVYFREPEGEAAPIIKSNAGLFAVSTMAVLVLLLGVFPGKAIDASNQASHHAVLSITEAQAAPAVQQESAPTPEPKQPLRLRQVDGLKVDPSHIPIIRRAMELKLRDSGPKPK